MCAPTLYLFVEKIAKIPRPSDGRPTGGRLAPRGVTPGSEPNEMIKSVIWAKLVLLAPKWYIATIVTGSGGTVISAGDKVHSWTTPSTTS